MRFTYEQIEIKSCGAASLLEAAAELGYRELTQLGNPKADSVLQIRFPTAINLAHVLEAAQPELDAQIRGGLPARLAKLETIKGIIQEKECKPIGIGSSYLQICWYIENAIYIAVRERDGLINPKGSWPSSIARTARAMGLRVERVYISNKIQLLARSMTIYGPELEIFTREFDCVYGEPPFPPFTENQRRIVLIGMADNMHWIVQRPDWTIMNPAMPQLISDVPTPCPEINVTALLAIEISYQR